MEAWLAGGSLPATTFIRSADVNSAAAGGRGEWRTLGEINERVAQATAEKRAGTKVEREPHWLFVDASNLTLGPSPHAHMVHWWQTGALHEDTYIRTADIAGNALGEWRALKWVQHHVPENECCAPIAGASAAGAAQSEGHSEGHSEGAAGAFDSTRDLWVTSTGAGGIDTARVLLGKGAPPPAPIEEEDEVVVRLPGGFALRNGDAATDEARVTSALGLRLSLESANIGPFAGEVSFLMCRYILRESRSQYDCSPSHR